MLRHERAVVAKDGRHELPPRDEAQGWIGQLLEDSVGFFL